MTSPPSSSDRPNEATTAFHRLHEGIRRWIWERGWTELRSIQEEAIDLVLAGTEDVIITASTAGGKTEAAFLPILTHIASSPGGSVRALYVSPLKALINDQFDRLSELGGRLGIPIHRWHGDVGGAPKRGLLQNPSGVLLITPESLEALFVLRGPQVGRIFSGLSFAVVDELHAFVGTERGRQLLSLLHRVEVATRRRVPRIALSATLGDMALAAEFLRPGGGASVRLVASADETQEIKLIVRGFRRSAPPLRPRAEDGTGDEAADRAGEDEIAVAQHLFGALRGAKNLVFANTRSTVESYADHLRRFCEEERLPQEFWPHHGSLSKEYREDAERLLKDPVQPATVVCTTTLEMGIDVGQVKSVAQIGAPPSVASLRQRLGRSGRRGEPAILRMYVTEEELAGDPSPQDALRAELVQAVATVRLLLRGWYEPPAAGMLHLSTLLQQVLSLVAQHGGVSAARAWEALCRGGPFSNVGQAMFGELLRSMGRHDLIAQMHDGVLVLGLAGERLVNHHTFFAVFVTPEEYRLTSGGKALGTLPITFPVYPEMFLIFGGRRWKVVTVDYDRKVLDLVGAPGGRVPFFGSAAGAVHDGVRKEMYRVYTSTEPISFLDTRAADLLREGRENFDRYDLARRAVVLYGKEVLLFLWVGDRALNTIQVQLQARGLTVTRMGLGLAVSGVRLEEMKQHLRDLVEAGPAKPIELAATVKNKAVNKYDEFLPDALLDADYAARAFEPAGAWDALGAAVRGASGDG